MNSYIQQLYEIANKESRFIIGLMSGTSLDGLDIALCRVTGHGLQTQLELVHFETFSYSKDFRAEVKTVFSRKEISLEKLCLLNPWIATQHADMVNSCLRKWGIQKESVDLIASHGQTIYHSPRRLHQNPKFGNATLQIGDADHLAVATGIITISDFRQKHIAAGGEGAPLAFYGDYILFAKEGEERILLNIGGIANFTYLPASRQSDFMCTDVGPGNTIMDAYIQEKYVGAFYDKNAQVAKLGRISLPLLVALKEDPFFKELFPKTTGPELFNLKYLQAAMQMSNTAHLKEEDVMATLNKFTADMIVYAIDKCISGKAAVKIFVSGGGIHNPLLIKHLQDQLPNCSFHSTIDSGINPDAKEAILFALLANECVCGRADTFDGLISDFPGISMGKISLPG